MRVERRSVVAAIATAAIICGTAPRICAQVGRSQGVADANTASETELAAMPHITPAVAKAIVTSRPFASITDLNRLLLAQGLAADQAMEFYARAFVHINLNTATPEEILLVPGAGGRMVREFAEYRPWKSYAQFDKEIGKYVGSEAAAKLAQYTFIPMNVNTAGDTGLLTIPGLDAKSLAAIKRGRPFRTLADLEKALGRPAGDKDVKRIERYLVLE